MNHEFDLWENRYLLEDRLSFNERARHIEPMEETKNAYKIEV
jgi:hypothetical protein